MGITFVTAGLAAGALLAAVPLVLHLLMRQTPRPIVFPAMRLIRERSKKAKKQTRLKNLLLLIARMALLAMMALALARPSFKTQASVGGDKVPAAIGLVIDTSLSMQYTERDQDRLSEAKKRAIDVLSRSHEASQVFVVDSSDPAPPVPLSLSAARKRVEALALRPVNRKLNGPMGQAYTAVLGSERPRKEVYVLSDMARTAWETDRPADGLDKVEKSGQSVPTYVLRLGVKDPVNVGLIDAEVHTAAGITTPGEAVQVRGVLRSAGPATTRTVEFFLDGPTKRDQKLIEIPANGETEVVFRTPRLEAGWHRGQLHVAGSDPLPFDDDRFVTFEVRPAFKVLVIADLDDDLDLVAGALDPEALPEGEPRPFVVDKVRTSRLNERMLASLRDYVCVIVNNVRKLDEPVWRALNSYLAGGGGLIVAIGSRADASSYAESIPARLLPAAIGEVKQPAAATTFGKVDYAHPIFRREQSEIPNLDADLTGVSIRRYQGLAAPGTAARVVMEFQDGAPCLIERDVPGTRPGRLLQLAIPLTWRPRADDPGAWHDWPLHWSFLDFLNQAVPYLAGAASERWNYQSGEFVAVRLDPGQRYSSITVQGPGDAPPSRLSPPAGGKASLLLEPPQSIGYGAVTALAADGKPTTYGFSVNPDPAESALAAVDDQELDAILGKGKYAQAEDDRGLKSAQDKFTFGVEMFPWLMFLVLVLITAEGLLANRFYRERAEAAPARSPA